MLTDKRLTILSGHYGSGKTNIAVMLAVKYAAMGNKVAVADLDIVNPYFRTKDSADILKKRGIRLISSEFAGSNVDLPALPQDMYALTDDRSITGIIDVGGDDRGALALGRLAPAILKENSFEMLMILNFYRPLTRTAEDALEVMREIETASGIPFTGLVNNSNLGPITTAMDVYRTQETAVKLSNLLSLPLRYITCKKGIESGITDLLKNNNDRPEVYGLELQKRPVD